MAHKIQFSRELPQLDVQPMVCRLVTLQSWTGLQLCHPFWRLYYNLDPGLAVDFDSRRVPLPPNTLLAIPPMCPCTAYAEGKARQLYIHFTASAPFDHVQPDVYAAPQTRDATTSVQALMDSRKRNSQAAVQDSIHVMALCLHLLKAIPDNRLIPQPRSHRVRQAIAMMQANPATPRNNPELAAELGMNTNAFINLFGRETGESPQRWYLQMRLRQAGLLLAHGNRSIEEIAAQTGFCDRNHFSKVFRRYHQIPPATYRRNIRQSG